MQSVASGKIKVFCFLKHSEILKMYVEFVQVC